MKTPRTDRRWDVLCLGDPCADVLLAIDEWPALGGKCVGRPLGTQAGGTAGNVACAIARLGGRAAAFGPVGDDPNGALLRASFEAFGVDGEHVVTVAGKDSSSVVVLLAPGGERTIVYTPMQVPVPDATVLGRAISQARVVYLMPYDLEELIRVEALARQAGTLVAIDLERAVAPGALEMRRRIERADIVFFNEEGFVAATGCPPNADTMAALLEGRPRAVVVTRGAAGAMAVDHTGFAGHGSFPCQVVDTTGAGDSFNAAWLYAVLAGTLLAPSLRFACAAASFAVGAIGARAGLPDRAQVESLLHDATTRRVPT